MLTAHPSRADIVIAVMLVVLTLPGQFLLTALGQQVSGWFGTLRVVNGVVIGGLTQRLLEGASRRQRLRQQQG